MGQYEAILTHDMWKISLGKNLFNLSRGVLAIKTVVVREYLVEKQLWVIVYTGKFFIKIIPSLCTNHLDQWMGMGDSLGTKVEIMCLASCGRLGVPGYLLSNPVHSTLWPVTKAYKLAKKYFCKEGLLKVINERGGVVRAYKYTWSFVIIGLKLCIR